MCLTHTHTRHCFLALALALLTLTARAADPGQISDLTITKTGPPTAAAGSDITYTIVVRNEPPAGGVTFQAILADTMPAGWSVINVTTTQGSCGGTGNSISCQLGALAPGQSATVTLRAHIPGICQPPTGTNVAVVSGDQDTTNNTASVTTAVIQPSLGAGACIPPAGAPSDVKPGSILSFPFYASSATGNGLDNNTRISFTNIHPTLGVAVHLFFIDGATCSVADSFICLSPNQTAAFLMSDIDPGTTGSVFAVASDGPPGIGDGTNTGCPISFNYLIGHASIKQPVGSSIGNAPLKRTRVEAEVAAEAIAAEFGSPVPGCNPSSPAVELRFNGQPNGYNMLPRVLAASNIPSRADGNSTFIAVQRIGGNLATGAATIGTLFGVLYDDAESPFSFSVNAGCVFRGTLSGSLIRTTPRFEQIIPAGRSGWLKLYGGADIGITGLMLNNNVNVDSAANAFDGGHRLHILRLTDTVVVTVPVFPPAC
ncbi:MAG: DUF11 domain-containing protein [Acidobacteria bacterium]|nr:DUF11 domain-containing protein [Acidobacteriota bacterium]MBI3425337.1 DUF11 domain-containing protein [Acidobacteriota bacterium]